METALKNLFTRFCGLQWRPSEKFLFNFETVATAVAKLLKRKHLVKEPLLEGKVRGIRSADIEMLTPAALQSSVS
jgi:hypothetical protein